ncbi:unnamed protein product [Camellia sinensis]
MSSQYRDGVKAFVQFAMLNVGPNGKIRCPCMDCLNCEQHTSKIVDKRKEALKKRREESLKPGAIPLTQEQLSIEVLGTSKSGYIKGFGVGRNPSSSKSSVSTQAHVEVVSSLQEQIESLKNLAEVQQEQIAAQNLVTQEQARKIEMQNKRFEEIEKFMRMHKDKADMQVDEDDCSSEEFY